MKVLYVGNFTPPDSPLGYCPNAEWISKTFEELGHIVVRMNEAEATPDDVVTELTKDVDLFLTEECRLKGDFKNDEQRGFDIVKGYSRQPIRFARNHRIPVVAWINNLFWGIMRREVQLESNPIFKADIVFTTDGGHDEGFKRLGINHRLLRQGIYDKEAYIAKPNLDIVPNIGFIGSIYEELWPYRKELVERLKARYGDDFGHFGHRGEVRHHELNELLSSLKVVVGDSVYSPHYWSNRIYEMLGRGAFLIHPMIEGLEKEFTPYEHFVPYKYGDWDNLFEKIEYYLAHTDEREKIRHAGFEHCRTHHTYKLRVQEMLDVLKKEHII